PAASAPAQPAASGPAPAALRTVRSHPGPRPVPPQAKRRPVVPPKVRKQQKKAVATLAERRWCAVAAGDRRALGRLLGPGSPGAGAARPGGLDRVAPALVAPAPPWPGLPAAARALAAWGRIAAERERLLAAHPPHPLAATVNRLVASRAGGRPTFAEAAARFG